MIVCHCKVVSDKRVAESVVDGACTLGQLCRATGAGQDCGNCVSALKRLLCEDSDAAVTVVPAMEKAAS